MGTGALAPARLRRHGRPGRPSRAHRGPRQARFWLDGVEMLGSCPSSCRLWIRYKRRRSLCARTSVDASAADKLGKWFASGSAAATRTALEVRREFWNRHALSRLSDRSDRVAGSSARRSGGAASGHPAQGRRTAHARSAARCHAGSFCHRPFLRYSGRSGSHRYRRRQAALSDHRQFFRRHGDDPGSFHQSLPEPTGQRHPPATRRTLRSGETRPRSNRHPTSNGRKRLPPVEGHDLGTARRTAA